MVRLPRWPKMAQGCQLSRDRARATEFARLGRSTPQAASLDHDGLGNRLAPLAVTRGRPLGIASMSQLGNQTGLLELIHGAQNLAHELGRWPWVREVGRASAGTSSMPKPCKSA
jgi:hypothetical protein